MLEVWGIRSTPSLPFLPGLLWPCVVAPDRVLSMGQIELNCILMLTELLEIEILLTIKLYLHLNCVLMLN